MMYVGARVKFVGDDIYGTVHEITEDYVYVAWDDNTENEEDPSDLQVIKSTNVKYKYD